MNASPVTAGVATAPPTPINDVASRAAELFGQAALQAASIPHDEPSDNDGPLGAAMGGAEVARVAPQLQSAVADASAAYSLLWQADNTGIVDGTDPALAGSLFGATERLALSARDAVLAATAPTPA